MKGLLVNPVGFPKLLRRWVRRRKIRRKYKSPLLVEGSELLETEKGLSEGPIIPVEWEEAVGSIVSHSATPIIAFICGGKRTGKSTFARYLVNALLDRFQRVGFIDTDVGQPELTPSGLVSLHLLEEPIVGVPILEMRNPKRCYFFGDISPKSNPEDYLANIFALHDYFQNTCLSEGEARLQNKKQTPLVINTHGWIQGIGFDVLVRMIGRFAPTHIIQIISKSANRNLPRNKFWTLKTIQPFEPELIYINSIIEDCSQLSEIKLNAHELRDLRLVSYFQKGLKERPMKKLPIHSVFRKMAMTLASVKPFQVPFSAIKVLYQHHQVPACESIYSLNATLVGLGVCTSLEKSNVDLQDKALECVGLGIVRGVDIVKGVLYVITPLDLEELRNVNVLLKGKIEIPVALLQVPGYVSPYLCRNVITIEGTGSAVVGSGRKKLL